MKIASIIVVVAIAIAAGAFYLSRPELPPCGDILSASNVAGCDILKEPLERGH